ncbi:MAG: hypothetical protein LQ347_004357 [Umbilicaria vellea]|nr:MAG: hypothetical protein LQ347_004357 [Umbilicaria vellea]
MAQQQPQGLALLQNNTLYFIVNYAIPSAHEEFSWGILAVQSATQSELWQPSKIGNFQVVYQSPSNIAASTTFLAAQKVGNLTAANLPAVRNAIAGQGETSVLGLDSRSWVAEVAIRLDHPNILPFTRTVHDIQERLISAGKSCRERVTTSQGPPIINNS